jgi:hypothetical protein
LVTTTSPVGRITSPSIFSRPLSTASLISEMVSRAFPTEPTIEMTAYHTPDGRSFDALTYSTLNVAGIFTLTVAEVTETGNQTWEDALMSDAIKKMTEGGLIKFDIPHRIRRSYGRQLGIAGTSGGYSYIAVFHRSNRLYQIEGKAFVAGGQAEVDAMRFQQSLDFP